MADNFARPLLDSMDAEARQRYIDQNGADAFARLWREAHRDDRNPPPFPSDVNLGGKVMRRADFDALPPEQQHDFILKQRGTVV